jgi:Transcriptional regulators
MQAIVSGELPPGTRLLEIQLAEEHAVSRATVREALAQLERSHLVERMPRYGARVAEISFEEIDELYALRAALLGLASERAARLASDEALQTLDIAVRELEKMVAAGISATTYTKEVLGVQETLIDISRSKWVKSMYDQISNQALWRVMVRGRGAVFSTEERRLASVQDWRRLCDALTQRDPVSAETFARQLVQASAEYVHQQYSSPGRPPAAD